MDCANLRQQMKAHGPCQPLSLAEFAALRETPVSIFIFGAFVVTAGIGEDARAKAFEAAHDDYSAIPSKPRDRPAEASPNTRN